VNFNEISILVYSSSRKSNM